jgi:hypothetical protein
LPKAEKIFAVPKESEDLSICDVTTTECDSDDASEELDVHGSVHRNINLTERTNKMQPCSRIYYSNVS